jgi:hypothetical protein
MLQAATSQSQVLIATQSVTLMNQFALDDLIVVERRQGASVFERPDPGKLRDWLAESCVTFSVCPTSRPAGGPAFKGGISTWAKLQPVVRNLSPR